MYILGGSLRMATSPLPEVILLEALVGLPSRKELLIESPRACSVKKFADELLATLIQTEDTEIVSDGIFCTINHTQIKRAAMDTICWTKEQYTATIVESIFRKHQL